MNYNKTTKQKREAQEEKRPYEAPSIIYTGQITTRAGTGGPGGEPDGSGEAGVDPADLFGD